MENDEQLVQADFWDKPYVVPAAVDPKQPNVSRKACDGILGQGLLGAKNASFEDFFDEKRLGQALFDIA